MTTERKLKEISVSNLQANIGTSYAYQEGPSEHMILPRELAKSLADKIYEVYAAQAQAQVKGHGDGVGVSESVTMRIGKPKGELH